MRHLILAFFIFLHFFYFVAQETIIIRTGESLENILKEVDQFLKDSLNPDITFNGSFKNEMHQWLDLKINGYTDTGKIGTAHMYSRIIGEDGLYLELILQGLNSNIKQIKSGDWKYHVGTNLSGIPDFYFADAIQRDGITYFVYCFD